MIYDVKQVKLVFASSHHSRIVVITVEEAIGIKGGVVTAQGWKTRKPAAQGRTHTADRDRIGMLLLEMVQEHLPHGVHTDPALFDQITYDGDTGNACGCLQRGWVADAREGCEVRRHQAFRATNHT